VKLQLGDALLEAVEIREHGLDRGLVVLGDGQLEQVVGVAEAGGQLTDTDDDSLQRRALAAEPLGAFRITPDTGILQLPQDFGQTLFLAAIVKETPSGTRVAPGDH